jgi:hypothetical protein
MISLKKEDDNIPPHDLSGDENEEKWATQRHPEQTRASTANHR